MTGPDEWKAIVGEACAGFRLDCVGSRPRIQYEQALIRAAVSEVLSLRLQAAYAPIFGTLQKIERKVGVLASLRREPWAPATHPVNRL